MADDARFDEFYVATRADLLRQLTAMTGEPEMAHTSLCWVENATSGGLTVSGYVQDGRLGLQHRGTWSSADGWTWTRSVESDETNMTVACNSLWETHWAASTDAGMVRVEPYAANRIYFKPAG